MRLIFEVTSLFNNFTEWTNQMASAERVLEYSKIQSESLLEIIKQSPPKTWPNEGRIRMDHLFLSYDKEGTNVLHDITLNIKSKEKVKSSFYQSLHFVGKSRN